MYISYLFRNRVYSKDIRIKFKHYVKRVITFIGLIRLEISAKRFSSAKRFGELAVVSPKCRVNGKISNLSIGNESSIGEAILHLHDAIEIGSYSVINHGVVILTASHDVNDDNWSQYSKPVSIGSRVWIATNAVILPGVSIGDGAVVAAGAVVARNVEPYRIVAGNPAKVVSIRTLNKPCYSPVRFRAPFDAWLGNAHLR